MSNPDINIFLKSAAPVSFLIVGFEVILKMKFSCPCILWLNQIMALFILIVPTVFAWVMMSLFSNFITPDSNGRSEAPGNNEKFNCMIKFIPPALWICIFCIDGDYCACGLTYWSGVYTCDTKLHPNCLSWCKPREGDGTKEYEFTQQFNNGAKLIGYALGFICCLRVCYKVDKVYKNCCCCCNVCCRACDRCTCIETVENTTI